MKEFCFCFDCECFDLCFWISTIVVPVITFIVIRCLRPRIRIEKLVVQDDSIKVDVTNLSRFFDANNLRVEICIYSSEKGSTIHLDSDHKEFLIIPRSGLCKKRDNNKTFVCRKIDKTTMDNFHSGYKVRVRCHAYHSFSGLGKSFEKIF